MSQPYAVYADLAREVDPPVNGTLSRTLLSDDHAKVVLFGFAAGQELSEHTASMPALLHFLSGKASVKLGDEWIEAQNGTLIHMPAGLLHAIRAASPTKMLLVLFKNAARINENSAC